MKKITKISSTAYRVLRLMILLNVKLYNIDELNNIFSADPNIARLFSKEVMLKYINTIKLAGYKIVKLKSSKNYYYSLIKAPVKIKLTSEHIKTLAFLENYVSGLYQSRLQTEFTSILNKLMRYSSDEQLKELNKERKIYSNNSSHQNLKYKKYEDLIKKIEQFCIEAQKVQIRYKLPYEINAMQVVLEPLSIKYNANDVWICGYNTIIGEKQLVHLEYIQDIKQLPIKSNGNCVLSPVIFKLKGRLAKGYRPYEGETITQEDKENDFIKILAYVDDKNQLVQRLLKYGDLCEILYPKSVRDKIMKSIKNTLNNYKITFKS